MTGQQFKVAHEGFLLQYLFEIFPGQSKTGVKNMLSKGNLLRKIYLSRCKEAKAFRLLSVKQLSESAAPSFRLRLGMV